jgi:hypothetical protein
MQYNCTDICSLLEYCSLCSCDYLYAFRVVRHLLCV